MSVQTCVAHPHLRGVHTRMGTHISEKRSAPICTKIAAPARAHARTLKVWILEYHLVWFKKTIQTCFNPIWQYEGIFFTFFFSDYLFPAFFVEVDINWDI